MKTKLFTLLFAVVASIGTMSAAITVRLDPSSCSSWSTVRLWAWTDEGNIFDSWPGQIVSLDGDGWYSYTFDEDITSVSIIWNNGSAQTIDIDNVTSSTCYALNSTSGTAITVSVVDCSSGSSIGGTPVSGKYKIGDLYYNLDATNQTAEVTSQNSSYPYWSTTITTAIIPASVEYNSVTYTVTSIGDWAFSFCTGLTSIEIPNSVTSIGENAFYNVPNIVYSGSATGSPWGARSINGYVDGYLVYSDETKTNLLACSSAATGDITIPNSVTSIGNYAFFNCSSLTSIEIPNSVTSIGEEAFYNVPNIVYSGSATGSPWGAISINGYVDGYLVYSDETKTNLLACSSAATGDITIPNSVTSIGVGAFENCTGLTSVTIGNSVASIGDEAFFNCSDLVAVNMPNSVIYIGHGAFYGCRNLTTITIPNKTERIEHEAFEHCTSLTSINIPSSVTSIEARSAFRGCTNLKSINVEENNPFYSSIDGVLFNKNKSSLLLYPAGNPNATYVVSDSVISIESEAFYSCVNLTSITIGKNVASIAYSNYGGSAFQYCSELITVILNSNAFVSSCSNIGEVFGSQVKEYIIGDSVKSVKEKAFRKCARLEKITIGKNISSLGKSVFNGCSAIKEVHWNALNYRQTKPNNDSNCFPFYSSRDSINSFIFGEDVEYIPEYLLKDFSAIHSLIIPASVKEIAKYAFANDSLTEMTCLAEIPPTIDSTTIVGMNTSTCVLYVPYSSVNTYRNANVWKEFVNIRAIGAEEVEEPEDDIVITPSNTTASIIWAMISNAVSYELVIRDMNGNVICTLTFNAYGQLTGIAFAPNRNRQAQQTQVAGFQFTVSGLENGTTYEYEFNAKDENDNIIETFTGTFTTTNDTPTSVENTPENMLNVPKKVMYNNQIFILRGDKVYTLQGAEVK